MIIAITFLLAFGLIMIFSASSYGTAASNFRSQLVFIVFGALAIWGLAFFPYGLYKKLTWPAYFLSLILTFFASHAIGSKCKWCDEMDPDPSHTIQNPDR